MEIKVETVASKRDENGYIHFSSAPSYDAALASIFPYFALLTDEEASEVGSLLSRGYDEKHRMFMPTSFAIVYTYNPKNTPRVLWMSAATVEQLKQHPDIYTLVYAE